MSRDKYFKGYNPDFVSAYGKRDWQKDMNGCQGLPPTPWQWVETDTMEWIEDANQKLVFGGEMSFWDWVGGNVEAEKLFRFFINAPDALPYWLQQYATEKERADKLQEALEQAQVHLSSEHYMTAEDIVNEALASLYQKEGEE
ncbi:hypothetical protein [Paenibacillus solani]|uniref:hypothetical protein n=1 Tax=Paenibacillus solani TaxID=1705565 RepID=UPI003D289ACE